MTIGSYLLSCLTVLLVVILPAYGLAVWRLRDDDAPAIRRATRNRSEGSAS